MPIEEPNALQLRFASEMPKPPLRLPMHSLSRKAKRELDDHATKTYIPADVCSGLLLLREIGHATIRGVTFDFDPQLVVNQGWKWPSHFASGQDLYSDGDPPLAFPWIDPDCIRLRRRKWIALREGDEIFIHTSECKPYGSELDDLRDQIVLELTLAIKRGSDVYVIEDKLTCFRPGSIHQTGMTYEAALGRLCEFVGIMPLDLNGVFADRARAVTDAYRGVKIENRDSSIWLAAWLAVKGAAFAGCGLDSPEARKIAAGHKASDVEAAALERTLRDMFLATAGLATQVGYALAKVEFAPHARDALTGRKRRAVSRQSGRARADALIAMTDKTWRAEALRLAKAMRSKNPKLGQKALAKWLVSELKSREQIPPDEDTVARRIRDWEKAGILGRSSQYRDPKRGGEY